MTNEPKPAAFFNLDNTVIQGPSLAHFIQSLTECGQLSWRNVSSFKLKGSRLRGKKSKSELVIEQQVHKAFRFLQGSLQSQFLEECDRLANKLLNFKINPQVLSKIHDHHRAGHDTWLLTDAPIELATTLAQRIGMTGALGTRSEILEGTYSGRLDGELLKGTHKAQAAKELAAIRSYDLTRSFAYSDSLNDLPLLASVGTPFVVNPNSDLARIARKNAWHELTPAA
ncbi:MAG: HAD-IB family hydrolase [Candidatus Nanopelagicales bacterium]|nr:HAD-IB family hydrolase [Candidatus Nanopelagicales bacterium]